LSSLTPNLRASGLMIAAFVIFSGMAILARAISDDIPVIQMVLVRQALSMVFLAPLFWRQRAAIAQPRRLGLHALRGGTMLGGMVCGLSSVILIPLADATAIQMAEVILATALAALILREPVGWRRWTATFVGFVGVAIMVRPFGAGVDPYAWVALLGAAFGAVNMVILRVGAEADRIETVLFWQNVVVLAIVLPPALWFWVPPTLAQSGILAVMAVIFTAGMWLMTSALRLGETSALAPLHYLRLLMMAVAGWFIYAEVPSLSTVIGAVLVLGAASYTISRNASKRVPQPPTPTAP